MTCIKKGLVLLVFFVSLPLLLWGCDSIMYPTISDVRTLTESENDHRSGLQEATVETMTAQHTAMTPELEAVFATILVMNQEAAASLKSIADEKAASVKGPEIGGLGALGGGLIPQLMSMFGVGSLIPIYNMFFGKSRAQSEIDDLKLKLATRAAAKDDGL